MKNLDIIIALILSVFLVRCQSPQKSKLIIAEKVRADHESSEAKGLKYAIATQGIYATKAARDVYALGGNAIDAAVAASFVISVERPHSTGIGGGGFMLYREGKTKKVFAIDFRERAPLKSKTNMFIGKDGRADSSLSQNGILATAVPGLVAGLIEVHQKFGSLPIKTLIQPAIDLAQNGFPIYPSLAIALAQKESLLAQDLEASKIFLDEHKKGLKVGDILVQKDLAKTLKKIAELKKSGFYQGEIAQKFAAFSKKSHGLITQKDLSSYQVKWRAPLVGSFKGHEIFSMPPPSSGGIHVIQFLNMLEHDDLKKIGLFKTDSIHLAASALQSAFSDRARYLGDPDFIEVPVKELISKEYSKLRRSQFTPSRARKANEVEAGDVSAFTTPPEHTETTHLSIIDESGDTVSTTQTINGYMGASIVIPGTGIVLNNEMDDFTAQLGTSNLFGAIGGAANSIEPRKTPLSSMSPTIITKEGKSLMSLGAPGGTRIISCVAQTILNYLEFRIPLFESVATLRYHHQWKPDVLDIDPPGPGLVVLKELQQMGYDVRLNPVPCNVMAVSVERTSDQQIFHAVSDPRDIGTSVAQ